VRADSVDPLSESDGTSFQVKALIFAAHLMLETGIKAATIRGHLSAVSKCLAIKGHISNAAELLSTTLTAALADYDRADKDDLWGKNDLRPDGTRVELVRAAVDEILAMARFTQPYADHAEVIVAMITFALGMSLRPGDLLITTDPPNVNKGVRAQHVTFFTAASHNPRVSDPSIAALSVANLVALPHAPAHVIGIEATFSHKGDRHAERGTRSVASNPNPSDPLDLTAPLAAYLRQYPPAPNGRLFSGAPLANAANGRFYYSLINNLLKSWAATHGIATSRVNPHCLRNYGHQQLTARGIDKEAVANQGGWVVQNPIARGPDPYHRLTFWNHAWREDIRSAMYARSVPLTSYERHRVGVYTTLPPSPGNEHKRRRTLARNITKG